MSSVAPPQDAIAAPSKKKNKKAKKPKKPIDANSKDGDGPAADQQPSPSPRDSNNNHDLSAGDEDEPSTPVVSLHQLEHDRVGGTHLRLVDTSFLPAYTVVQYSTCPYMCTHPLHEAILGRATRTSLELPLPARPSSNRPTATWL